MKLGKEFLIPVLNHELREGVKIFDVYEGWRKEKPLFSGEFKDGKFSVTSIGRYDYKSIFPDIREFPNFFDLIQKVLHGSCIIDPDEISDFHERFESVIGDEEPYKRNVRFYYDTNSLMNNYFYNFREFIPRFTRKAGHTTSFGVMGELERLLDRTLKNQFFPDEFDRIYSGDGGMFYGQPNLVGRMARLAYPEIDYMKDQLRSNILTDNELGDTEILNAFMSDCNDNNLEGIIVTNDSTMAERASRRMGSWHVKFELDRIVDIPVNMEYFLEAIYRASILYGRIRINDGIIVDGVWKGKGASDWSSNLMDIRKCNDCGLERIERIIERIPGDFFGKGYYRD